jgi:hypothetical protein
MWRKALMGAVPLVVIAAATAAAGPNAAHAEQASVAHVLLLSVDGLHASDLARYVRIHPDSALAQLSDHGITYTNASTSKPSDSFPGLLSMVTGGSPKSTGVFYDDSYDRTLSAPGSNCRVVGTEVVYDESIDKNPNALDAGGGIDPTTLPLDPSKGCTPVYPHAFLKVNTIFEVIKKAGDRTAWSDKHPAYDIVNGPSGKGVDDLYTPEIASTDGTVLGTQAYDDLKVTAVLNEIDGKDHTGTETVGVPTIFGMNFQSVSVAQKIAGGGYTDANGTPSPTLAGALDHTDQSLNKFISELRRERIWDSTLVVLTAKHGQSPIDPSLRQIVDKNIIPNLVNSVQAGLLGQSTEDDVALIWLNDQSKTNDVVAKLNANKAQAHIQDVLSGNQITDLYGSPTQSSRVPDIVVLPDHGVIYAKLTATKLAEHGGFADDDTHVALLLENPNLGQASSVSTQVQTTQIAPTILEMLGLDPQALQAVVTEGTQTLPVPTRTAIGSSANPTAVGKEVTYTATVSPLPTGGTVSFTDNGAAIATCQSVALTGASASCTVSYASTGVHNIVAKYSGTAGFVGSTSPILSEIVSQTPCATFAGCNLNGVDLSGANLSGVNLSGANLNKANLTNANLSGANLSGANLNKANLTKADLDGATTAGANFSNVTWSNTTCPDGTNSNTNGGTCAGHL